MLKAGTIESCRLSTGQLMEIRKIGRSYTFMLASPDLMVAPDLLMGLKKAEANRAYTLHLKAGGISTKPLPSLASKHLHYVAEECGYMVGRLNYNKDETKISLVISTHEGSFRLEWANSKDGRTQLISIEIHPRS